MRKLMSAMLVVATMGAVGTAARAEVPFLVPVVGVLTDADDVPLDGSETVVFTLYTEETGGLTLWGETQTVEFADGLFRVYLGSMSMDGMDVTDFVDNDEVWLGVRVGSDSEMNRVRMAAVPWAFEAETCGQVTDLAAAGIQESIGADACAAGQAMRGWTGSAAVCVALPDVSDLVAESDIGTTVQAPIDQANFPCNYGVRQISAAGAVVCANQDVVTQCGPEAGLGSNDNYLGSDGACHKAVHSCTANQYLAGGATGTCQEGPHKCGLNQYIDGDGACQTAPHSCNAGQYLDGNGTCVTMAVSGTANTLAMFTNGTTVGNSIVTQSGTTGVSVAGTATVSGVTTVNNYLVATGGVRVGSASNPGANNLSVAGNAAVGGTATVTGNTTINGNLGVGVSPTADLHVVGNVKMLADPASRSANTVYTEGSDGFVFVTCNAGTGEFCAVIIYADTNATPGTLRGIPLIYTESSDQVMIPVRQNWNWRVTTNNPLITTGDVTISWWKLGI